MNTHRKVLFAAMGCLLWSAPVLAAPDGTRGLAIMSAVVEANGNLNRGSGVVSSDNVGTPGNGTYAVTFDRFVAGCTYVASTGGPGLAGTPDAGMANLTGLSGNASGLFVTTYNQTGAAVNRAFHLIVFCSR